MEHRPSTSFRSGSHGSDSGERCTAEVSNADPLAELWSARTRDRLLRLAFRFLWNRNEAEDCVQDSLAVAYSRLSDLREASKWWPWVCRIVVNRCHEMRRFRGLVQRFVGRLDHERCETVEMSTGGDELVGAIPGLLERLPRRQREVLVLKHLSGMTFDEVAEVLGIAPESARIHAMRGREKLLAVMRGAGFHDAM